MKNNKVQTLKNVFKSTSLKTVLIFVRQEKYLVLESIARKIIKNYFENQIALSGMPESLLLLLTTRKGSVIFSPWGLLLQEQQKCLGSSISNESYVLNIILDFAVWTPLLLFYELSGCFKNSCALRIDGVFVPAVYFPVAIPGVQLHCRMQGSEEWQTNPSCKKVQLYLCENSAL